MKETILGKNSVRVIGVVSSDLVLSHSCKDVSMYNFMIQIPRDSGTIDEIPVTVSSIVLENIGTTVKVGSKYEVVGEYRSYNERVNSTDEGHSKLKLFIIAKDIYEASEEEDKVNNIVELEGYIAKVRQPRETPLGRKIVDLIIAVNRRGNKSSYIPCIIWNPTNYRFNSLEVGKGIAVKGRIQSRAYNKKLEDETQETRVAYEVSVQNFSVEEKCEEAVE